MLRKLAAAVVAISLIGGPALAQGTTPASGTSQPAAVKSDAPKSDVKTVKSTRHHGVRVAKHHKVRKHVTHARHIKHVKQAKQPAKTKPAS